MSKSQNVIDFRKRIKFALVEAFGNKCQICGNSYPLSVYEFHHLNPKEKAFSINGSGITHSMADCANEAKKCIMVCANCHRLIGYEGLIDNIPVSIFNEEIYYNTLEQLKQQNKEEKAKKKLEDRGYPNREELKSLIRNTSFTQIGRQFGVSDNSIRKLCIKYGLPSRVSDIKNISDEEWKQI